ncbi:MAG: universal stress protein [Bacteroidales bacterium]|jgi:nucleotide-binding universal stress UspA family protein|nr:universal stress protein [Bacteroidales bacterium]
MSEEKKTILVTWDFSEPAVNALKHAARIGKSVDNYVALFHVTMEESKAEEAEEKLKEACIKYSAELGHDISYILKSGSIFDEISNYASEEENNVNFVLLGTHGIKGSQKLFGSKALRVINGSKAPFMVVQKAPPEKERISNIVFPIDFKSENKEKLQWAIFLGKYLNSKIHLFKSGSKDKSLQKKANVNLNFAIRFLIQNNIEYEIHVAPDGSNFMKETLSFAKSIDSDLILITTTKHMTFVDLVFAAKEQYLIANDQGIPVMCVNPRSSFAKVSQFMYG